MISREKSAGRYRYLQAAWASAGFAWVSAKAAVGLARESVSGLGTYGFSWLWLDRARLLKPRPDWPLGRRPEVDVPETVETNPWTRRVNFSDDLYQGDIPSSVGGNTKDISHENDSRQPSRALFSMEATAEALNDGQLKLVQNSNIINIEQSEGQFENMRMSGIG